MGKNSQIEWTDATWNPVMGCTPISEGCTNCYARLMMKRFAGCKGWPDEPGKVTLFPERLNQPLRWRGNKRIFIPSMGDLFHRDVPNEFIWRVFEIMGCSRKHTFQLLTKRPKRMAEFFRRCKLVPSSNIWGMVTVESQEHVWRIEELLKCSFVVHGVSCEPLLGSVDLRSYFNLDSDVKTGEWIERPGSGLSWVIAGGESGPGARPMHPDWARDLRDQCQAADVPFHFKQHGAWVHQSQWASYDTEPLERRGRRAVACHWWPDGTTSYRVGKKDAGRLLDGRTWDEFPA